VSANSDDLNYLTLNRYANDCHGAAAEFRDAGFERAADKMMLAYRLLEEAEEIRSELEDAIQAVIRYGRGDWGRETLEEAVAAWEAKQMVPASRGRGRPLMGQRRKRRR